MESRNVHLPEYHTQGSARPQYKSPRAGGSFPYHPTSWRSCSPRCCCCCCAAPKVSRCLCFLPKKTPECSGDRRIWSLVGRWWCIPSHHSSCFFSSVLTLRCYTCRDESDGICKEATDCPTSSHFCKTFESGTSASFVHHLGRSLEYYSGRGAVQTSLKILLLLFFHRRSIFSNLWGLLCRGTTHDLLQQRPLPLSHRFAFAFPSCMMKIGKRYWLQSEGSSFVSSYDFNVTFLPLSTLLSIKYSHLSLNQSLNGKNLVVLDSIKTVCVL